MGWDIVEYLRSFILSDCEMFALDGEPTKMMDLWVNRSTVVVVDAVVTGNAPLGTIYQWEVSSLPLPQLAAVASSHILGLSEAIELSRVLQQLPTKMMVYGIESKEFGMGAKMSAEVADAVAKAATKIAKELGEPYA